MSVFFRKYARYLSFFLITLLILWGFITWRQLLLPFIIGLALAYLLLPVVKWVERYLPGERHRWQGARRIGSILIVTLAALTVFGLIIYFAANAIAASSADLITNASHFIDTATARLQEWTGALSERLPAEWQESLNNVTAGLGDVIANAVQGIFAGGGSVITDSLSVIFSFAALPLFLFYMLKDADKMKRGLLRNLPSDAGRHTLRILGIIERTLGRYFRAQLILGLAVGILTLIGLFFIEGSVAIPLAIVNGFLEVVPTIGPIIGGVVMAVVMLAIAPDKVLWAVLLAVVVQLLENNILVPRIQAANLRMHPALVLFLLVTGSYFWGFWGLVFTVPIVATLIDVFKYIHDIDGNTRAARRKAFAK